MDQSVTKRKEKLSLARVQLKLVALVCVPLVVACSAVSYLLTYFFLSSLRSKGISQTAFAQEIIPTSIIVSAIVLLILLGACFAVSVLVGHRIVGPMRRLATRLRVMAGGQLRQGFHMRVGDDLYFVGEALAEMENTLIERLQDLREVTKQLEAFVDRQADASQNGSSRADLETAVIALREQLQAFDLGDEEQAPTDVPVETPSAT